MIGFVQFGVEFGDVRCRARVENRRRYEEVVQGLKKFGVRLWLRKDDKDEVPEVAFSTGEDDLKVVSIDDRFSQVLSTQWGALNELEDLVEVEEEVQGEARDSGTWEVGERMTLAQEEGYQNIGLDHEEDDDSAKDEVAEDPSLDYRWYIVQVRPAFEETVRVGLTNMVANLPSIGKKIPDIVNPMKKQAKYTKGGKLLMKDTRIFPGYLLIRSFLDEEVYNALKSMSYVQGFVGDPNQENKNSKKKKYRRPEPLSESEVRRIFDSISEAELTKPTTEISFKPGDLVRVTSGPFKGNDGKVLEVKFDVERVTVCIVVFGKETKIDLEFNQIVEATFL
mmetsp:Transcript_11996/g.24416  ORF Transcript_11996/g.24416 Transcript_11996/m.24416 type:complete len:337 (-) Transcript_11996:3317-4327(-)